MRYSPYEFKRQDAYDFARYVHIQAKEKGDELHFVKCPYCGMNTKDKYTFAISLTNGVFKCLRSSCGVSGNMIKLSQDFGFSLGNEVDNYFKPQPTKKKFKKPDKPIEPKPPAIQYLASRGISEETAKKYEITTQTDKDNLLVFPFYADNGDLMFIKYRKTDFDKEKDKNKEWCQSGGTPILFGMNHCNFENKTLIITEGQMDSLSVADCGFENALSVPTGAKGFTWVPNCWDFVNKFDSIIVFGDYEKGKISLLDEIKTRFRRKRVKHVREEDYKDCKDANDILRKYGKNQIKVCIENAVDVPISHVVDIADVEDLNPFDLEKLKTGFKDLDQLLYGGLPFCGVTIITGKSGLGKSTMASQILLNAIETNHKVFAYSGELPNHNFKAWITYQAAGSSHVITYDTKWGDKGYNVSSKNKSLISEWLRGKLLLFDDGIIEEDEMVDLLKIIEDVICRLGCNVILIDNLMTAIDIFHNGESDKYERQSKFVKALARLAMTYNVLIMLVAHMRKNTYGKNGNDEVGGSSDITNLAAITLMIDKDEDSGSRVLKCWKNRLFGKINETGWQINYDDKSKRLYGFHDDVNRKYSWEKFDEEGFIQLSEDDDTPFT